MTIQTLQTPLPRNVYLLKKHLEMEENPLICYEGMLPYPKPIQKPRAFTIESKLPMNGRLVAANMMHTTTAFLPMAPCLVPGFCSPFLSAEGRRERPFFQPKRSRTRPPRMQETDKSAASESEDDFVPSGDGGDWREFRAALVAGSIEALEKTKRTAYRTGHWAHAVSRLC